MNIRQLLHSTTFTPAMIMDEEAGAEGGEAGGGAEGESQTGGEGESQTAVGGDQGQAQAQNKGQESAQTGEQAQATDNADWRKQVAGEDEKLLKKLERYQSMGDLGRKITEMEKTISKMPKQLGDNPSEQEVEAYRKANNIPLEAKGYQEGFELPEGTVIGEADQPLIDDFLSSAHDQNWSQGQVNQAVNWYFSVQQQQEALMAEQENAAKAETIQKLRESWGPDYDNNRGMINAWLQRQPNDFGQMLANARGPDGRALLNNADFVEQLGAMIRENEPSATVMHNTEMAGKSVQDRIAEIQKVIRDNPAEYKGNKKLQAEMEELSAIKARMQAA